MTAKQTLVESKSGLFQSSRGSSRQRVDLAISKRYVLINNYHNYHSSVEFLHNNNK